MTAYTIYPTNVTGPNPTIWVVFNDETQDAELRTESRTEAEKYIQSKSAPSPLRALHLARVAYYLSVRTYFNALALNMPKSAMDKYERTMLDNASAYQTLINN